MVSAPGAVPVHYSHLCPPGPAPELVAVTALVRGPEKELVGLAALLRVNAPDLGVYALHALVAGGEEEASRGGTCRPLVWVVQGPHMHVVEEGAGGPLA